MKVKTEWKNAPDFAEFAEALGIRTKQIMAAQFAASGVATIIYTPEPEEADLDPETMILATRVTRDGDGIMRQLGEPVMLSMNFGEMQAKIEAELERHADDRP